MNSEHILKKNLVVIYLMVIVSACASYKVFAAEHEHHLEENEAKLSLNKGKKWSIDESLHLGMSNIKTLIANDLQDIHHERFTDEQYGVLAAKLDIQLSFLFENCKLPPLADAQLHTLLAKVLLGVDKIKHSTSKKHGAVIIIQALNDYPVYFSDAKWKELKH